MSKYKLLTPKDWASLSKQLDSTPCLLLAGSDEGRVLYKANVPQGKPDVMIQMLLSAMAAMPDFAHAVQVANVAYNVKKTAN